MRSRGIKQLVHQGTENVWLRKVGGGGDKAANIRLGRALRPSLHTAKTLPLSRGRGVHKKDNRSRHVKSSECGAGMLHRTTYQWGVNSVRQEEAKW